MNGQFGTVHIVPTNWAVLNSRVNLQANHHPYWNTVAIKMLYNFRAPNSQITHYQKSMFDQEYSFPCTFPSWTIVNVFNYFRADLVPALLPDNAQVNIFSERTTYFTMEAGAGSLETFLKTVANLDTHTRLIIVFQILLGVQHIASKGHAHLDLKLDNIVWLNSKRPKILGNHFVIGDLGTALLSPVSLQGNQGIVGNLINRAPEVFERVGYPNIDVSANDIWAVGCIMYEIIQNSHPFSDPNAQHSLQLRICLQPLPQLSQQYGYACNRLLQLMWNRDWKNRISPRSAVALCGILLWGCPKVTAAVLRSCSSKNDLLNALGGVVPSVNRWEAWLKAHCLAMYHSIAEGSALPIETILELYFFTHLSAQDLFFCMGLLLN